MASGKQLARQMKKAAQKQAKQITRTTQSTLAKGGAKTLTNQVDNVAKESSEQIATRISKRKIVNGKGSLYSEGYSNKVKETYNELNGMLDGFSMDDAKDMVREEAQQKTKTIKNAARENAEFEVKAAREEAEFKAFQDEFGDTYSSAGDFDLSGKKTKSKTIKEESKVKTNSKPRTLDEYTSQRVARERAGFESERDRILESFGDGSNADYNKTLSKKLGIDDPTKVTSDSINAHYQSQIDNIKTTSGIGDWMGYNKVPQKTAAVGGTAWLVSNMSQSKGQLSNPQLYSQQQPYGNGGY